MRIPNSHIEGINQSKVPKKNRQTSKQLAKGVVQRKERRKVDKTNANIKSNTGRWKTAVVLIIGIDVSGGSSGFA